jgi:hypothetical protein
MLCLVPALIAGTISAEPATKTYQVTGPILELTDKMIVVQKGEDRWELARDADTKVTGDLKVGSKVTISYRMTAATVEVKAGSQKADRKKK